MASKSGLGSRLKGEAQNWLTSFRNQLRGCTYDLPFLCSRICRVGPCFWSVFILSWELVRWGPDTARQPPWIHSRSKPQPCKFYCKEKAGHRCSTIWRPWRKALICQLVSDACLWLGLAWHNLRFSLALTICESWAFFFVPS